MSTALYVYSVPLERLRGVAGSRDRALIERILAADAEQHQRTDAAMQQCVEDEALPRFLSCREAVRQIVQGESLDADLGMIYAHAYESIVRDAATAVAGEWSPIVRSYELFERLDAELARLGARISFAALTGAGPVFPLPNPVDFPALGWWSPEDIAASLGPVLKGPGFWRRFAGPQRDEELEESLHDVSQWLRTALKAPGDGLVGVQHY